MPQNWEKFNVGAVISRTIWLQVVNSAKSVAIELINRARKLKIGPSRCKIWLQRKQSKISSLLRRPRAAAPPNKVTVRIWQKELWARWWLPRKAAAQRHSLSKCLILKLKPCLTPLSNTSISTPVMDVTRSSASLAKLSRVVKMNCKRMQLSKSQTIKWGITMVLQSLSSTSP